jgi:hypothetical protein
VHRLAAQHRVRALVRQREGLGAAFQRAYCGQLAAQLGEHGLIRLDRHDIGTEAGERAGQDAGPRAHIHHPDRPRIADRGQAPADGRFGVVRAVLRVLRGRRAE